MEERNDKNVEEAVENSEVMNEDVVIVNLGILSTHKMPNRGNHQIHSLSVRNSLICPRGAVGGMVRFGSRSKAKGQAVLNMRIGAVNVH